MMYGGGDIDWLKCGQGWSNGLAVIADKKDNCRFERNNN